MTPTETKVTTPIRTPWGNADWATTYAPGIVFYSTPGHGGFHLSPDRQAELQRKFPGFVTFRGNGPAWFEEDCDACAVILTWPELFPNMDLQPIKACFEMYCRPRMRRPEAAGMVRSLEPRRVIVCDGPYGGDMADVF